MEEGWMTATSGNVTDYAVVRADINSIAERYNILSLAYDPGFARGDTRFGTELLEDGLPVVEFANTPANVGGPARTFLELVASGKLHHGGNPIFRWMAGNLVMKKVGEALLPDKAKSHEKIDAISATVMALGSSIVPSADEVYSERGILVI
jgi:phage terminase large subunit-like protein